MRALALAAVLVSPFSASADVIDFSSLAFNGTGEQHFASVVVGDYVFTALQPSAAPLIVLGKSDVNNADQGGGTLGLRTSGSDLGVSFARIDGAAFDLTSIQVTHLSNSTTSSGNGGTLRFTFDGVTAFQSSYDINPGFQTYALAGSGLHSVQITSNNYFQFDNLVVSGATVSAVPEAASWLYLSGGLVLLGGAYRRRRGLSRVAGQF